MSLDENFIADELFDVSQLQKPQKTFIGSRYSLPGQVEIKPISYYEHFVTKGVEYINLPIYSLETDSLNILSTHNFTTLVAASHGEPIVLSYRKTTQQDTYKQKHDIVMCVYFLQNSNEEIERFFNYYLNQGIEKFFMYYCGNLSDRPNLPQRTQVEYLEWNYPHYIEYGYDKITKNRYHYSQISLYNTFGKKISPHCKWTIFCDLDEFIKAPDTTIKNYLNSYIEPHHLFTDHRWSKINFNTNTILYEQHSSVPGRGKSIINGNIIEANDRMGIHTSPISPTQKKPHKSNLLMFHNKTFNSYTGEIIETTL